ncbi:MAG: hypothetical protein ATN34_05460 [Epulopiscium sp. Nele67-Bin002]|nr:MAG: hypothetical protein ATN34_05460 [Epulopiscium sp. Nele67-Bin002]
MSTLRQNFNQDYINGILDALLQRFASTFVQINLVDLVYDNYIEQVRSILTRIVDLTSKYVATKNEWEQRKDTLLKLLSFRMLALFDYEIESGVIIEFVDEIRANGLDIELHKSLLRYI